MPITVGDIVNALEALGGEAHYADITDHILVSAQGPFPADPQASVRARLQERCSGYKAYTGHVDLFESEQGTGVWRFRNWQTLEPRSATLAEERDAYEAFEGALVPKAHFMRERDAKLIAKFKASLTEPRCEACTMSFVEVYGELGADYIEAHHKTPLSQLGEGDATTIADLAALCPNCHRVVHKNYPMSVDELKQFLGTPEGFAEQMNAVRKTRETWRLAVEAAIRRLVASQENAEFSRQDIIENELSKIIEEVQSSGQTPMQTLSRVLQELRQAGVIDFLDERGRYKLIS